MHTREHKYMYIHMYVYACIHVYTHTHTHTHTIQLNLMLHVCTYILPKHFCILRIYKHIGASNTHDKFLMIQQIVWSDDAVVGIADT